MVGLLYKDFIAVRGKMYAICSGVALVLIFFLRMTIQDEQNEYVLILLAMVIVLAVLMLMTTLLEKDLMQVEGSRRQKEYYLSLPISKNQYVASKYIFLLLLRYFITTFCVLLCNIVSINCQTDFCMQVIGRFSSYLPIITDIIMLLYVIELPVFIGFGYKKGDMLKQAIVILLAYIILIYLMLGDLSIFSNFSSQKVFDFLATHVDVMTVIQVLSPMITLILYYLSYKVACILYRRREIGDE